MIICETCFHRIEPQEPRFVEVKTYADDEGVTEVRKHIHQDCLPDYLTELESTDAGTPST